MPEKIVFDLGNVLFPLEYDELYTWLKTTVEVYDQKFQDEFDELYIKYEAGEFDTREFFRILRSDLRMQFEDEMFRQKWVSIWKRDVEGVHELLHELKSLGHPLHVLSNTNEMHISEYLKTRPILKLFDHAFYSHELQIAKPHREIYLKVQSLLGVEPNEIVFFDDKPENVEGARSAGWNAYVFKDAAGVRKELGNLGWLS